MNGEFCVFVFRRINSNVSTMILCYLLTQIQSHARSLCRSLCGKERVEYLMDNVLADTRTVIMYLNRYQIILLAQGQDNLRRISCRAYIL